MALDWAAFALVPSIIQLPLPQRHQLAPKWRSALAGAGCVPYHGMGVSQEFAETGISGTLPGDLLGQSHPGHSQQE